MYSALDTCVRYALITTNKGNLKTRFSDVLGGTEIVTSLWCLCCYLRPHLVQHLALKISFLFVTLDKHLAGTVEDDEDFIK